MSQRAEALAQRIEQGAKGLAEFAQGLTETQWNTVCAPERRTIGVIVHHVASVYPIEIHLATELATGNTVTGVTWDVVAEMNANHARENATADKASAIDLLRRNSQAAAEAVRAFTDEQLDRAASVSLNANAPLTTQFMIEDHAVRHSWHHLAKIKAALQLA
jgi:hypothetical protein